MDKARTFYWYLSLSPMAYHILRRILTFMRIPLVYGSSAPLDNILYHKNVPMIMQSLGSNGYLPSIYSLIAHSITLVWEQKQQQVETHWNFVASPRRFWKIDSESLNTCSVSLCQPVNERCRFFFRQIFGRVFCLGYLGLKIPPIIVEQNALDSWSFILF